MSIHLQETLTRLYKRRMQYAPTIVNCQLIMFFISLAASVAFAAAHTFGVGV